jgi:hypothetical protein
MLKPQILHVDPAMESGRSLTLPSFHACILLWFFYFYVLYMQFNYYLLRYYFTCSIGSLGAGGSFDYVSNVMVNRAILTETTNGLRIKTWQVINN